MKKSFVSCFLCLGAMCLSSCGNPKEYKKALNHLKSHLKDPESLIISSGECHADPKDNRCTFRLVYNAKNSFGGYVGSSTVYILCNGGIVDSCSHCEVLEGNAAFYYKLDAGKKDTTIKV